MAAYEMAVLINGSQPLCFKGFAFFLLEQNRIGPAQQLPGKGPVQKPHGKLKGAGPVRAQRVRALFEPGLQQGSAGKGVFRVFGEVVGLGQGGEFEVSVGFPEVFDVSD